LKSSNFDAHTSNYVARIDSEVNARIDTTDANLATTDAGIITTSNILFLKSSNFDAHTSNYVAKIDSEVNARIDNTNANLATTDAGIITTSNILFLKSSNFDAHTSNYLARIDGEVNARIDTTNTNLATTDAGIITTSNILFLKSSNFDAHSSNYVARIDSEVNNRIDTTNTNLAITDANLVTTNAEIISTSNILFLKSSNFNAHSSNYVARIDSDINTRIDDVDNVTNILSYFRVSQFELDNNDYINIRKASINNLGGVKVGNNTAIDSFGFLSVDMSTYTGDVEIVGDLTTSNLTILGDSTTLETNVFTTERLEINNIGSGTGISVVQSGGTEDIFTASNGSGEVFSIINNGNVGIGITNPSVSLQVIGTDGIVVPVGTEAQRPANITGLIRYNTTTSSFEGYGTAWGSLGGVKDVDGDTHISAETSAGIDNDELKFTTAGTERMIIGSGGNVGIGVASPVYKLDVDGDINISSGKKYKINGTNLQQSDIEGVLSLSAGGTGATDAASARTALGVDVAGTDNSTNVTLANVAENYLSINVTNQIITAGQVPISLGGTGASTLSGAKTALGITDVLLASVTDNYLSVSGNTITAGIVPLSLGGTGATTVEQARTNLGIINNVKADWAETNTSVESFIENKPFTSLDSNTLEVTNGVLTVISGSGLTSTTYIQEPTYDASTYITKTTIDSEYKYIMFENDGNNQSSYNITFPENTECDILIVGGGGAGGVNNGGGGGGGGVLYATGIELNGEYIIKVGNGGQSAFPVINAYNPTNSGNGYSSIFGKTGDLLEILGGGYGGNAGVNGASATNGGSGGSGGGGVYTNGSGGSKTIPTYNTFITSTNSTYYGGNGGSGVLSGSYIGGGGGGAGGITPTNYNGADGIQINIDGNNYYYGGGGGGIHWANIAGSGGLGGGGGGGGSSENGGSGGTGGRSIGGNGTGSGATNTPTGIGGNGGAGTGGGGGGDAYSSQNRGGNGGSGIVIIKYKYITSSTSLEVNGDINISSGSKYKINGTNLQQSDIEGILALSAGGTGATDAASARIAIGVDPAGTDNSTNVTLANTNYLTISGQEITGNTIPIASGGTGATTAEQARTNLGIINNVKADWAETNTSVESFIENKPFTSLDTNTLQVTDGVLSAVVSSVSYNDLTNKPIFNTNHFDVNTDITTGNNTVDIKLIPISNGGTGATTQTGAVNNILPTVTTGHYLKYDGTNWVGSEVQVSGGKWKLIGDTDYYSYYSSNVKIGGDEEVTPVAKLEVNGDIVATGDMTAGYSDDRLKDYISNIENPIDIIKSLNGYYFKPNELANSLGYTNREKEVGVSAQEVNSVLPEIVKLAPFDSMRNLDNELVSKSGSNYLTVNYEKMAPLFIEAIKALNDKIDSMTTELNSLKEFKKSVLNQQNF